MINGLVRGNLWWGSQGEKQEGRDPFPAACTPLSTTESFILDSIQAQVSSPAAADDLDHVLNTYGSLFWRNLDNTAHFRFDELSSAPFIVILESKITGKNLWKFNIIGFGDLINSVITGSNKKIYSSGYNKVEVFCDKWHMPITLVDLPSLVELCVRAHIPTSLSQAEFESALHSCKAKNSLRLDGIAYEVINKFSPTTSAFVLELLYFIVRNSFSPGSSRDFLCVYSKGWR